jgi:hypothetical protein
VVVDSPHRGLLRRVLQRSGTIALKCHLRTGVADD